MNALGEDKNRRRCSSAESSARLRIVRHFFRKFCSSSESVTFLPQNKVSGGEKLLPRSRESETCSKGMDEKWLKSGSTTRKKRRVLPGDR
jgi:hypothetical protein